MKKLLTMALMFVVLVCALAITASAVEHNGIYYSLNATNKTATVTNENVNCTLTEVVIPETITIDEVTYTVTKVDGNAFAGSDWTGKETSPAIKKITFPSSITSFGDHVFRQNETIEEVIINSNITDLNDAVFYKSSVQTVTFNCPNLKKFTKHIFEGCSKLTSVNGLPEGMTTIGSNSFKGCSNLSSIYLPTTLTTIGSWAFNSCSSLKGTLYLPNVTSLGENSLQSTSFDVAILPNVTSSGKDVFNSSKIKFVVLSHDISNYASTFFSSCGSLRVVIFLGEDGSIAKDKVSTLNSFTVKSFSEYDPSIDYASGSDKIIFDGLAKAGDSTESYICFESYDKAFYTYNITTNEKATYGAILTHLGFSTNPSKDGIATGYSINRESLNQYEDIYGKLEIGVAIFNPSYLGDGSFFVNGNELNVSKGALQVSIDTKYTTCNVYINGFNSTTSSLELVFASYAYLAEDESTIELVQKLYEGTEQSPVNSPMQSLVVRGDASLYTVTLESILAPAEITAGKDALEEFGA